jgi:ABC-type phosphate/phosphonate transport system substrate-binding protein
MDSDPEGKETLKKFGAKRFIKTTINDYKPVFDIAQKAGIDLKKYQYINK